MNPSSITHYTIISDSNVKMLRSKDFNLDSSEKISIKDKGCTIILFYIENQESKDLLQVWITAARQTAGAQFAAVNLSLDKDIATAFQQLESQGSPLRVFSLKAYPAIIVYRNSWPSGFYNGERSADQIANFALDLACQSSYLEQIQEAGGLQLDTNPKIDRPGVYINTPQNPNTIRRSSVQFKSDNPIDTYDPNAATVRKTTPTTNQRQQPPPQQPSTQTVRRFSGPRPMNPS